MCFAGEMRYQGRKYYNSWEPHLCSTRESTAGIATVRSGRFIIGARDAFAITNHST